MPAPSRLASTTASAPRRRIQRTRSFPQQHHGGPHRAGLQRSGWLGPRAGPDSSLASAGEGASVGGVGVSNRGSWCSRWACRSRSVLTPAGCTACCTAVEQPRECDLGERRLVSRARARESAAIRERPGRHPRSGPAPRHASRGKGSRGGSASLGAPRLPRGFMTADPRGRRSPGIDDG
jgi:hypothetical protein